MNNRYEVRDDITAIFLNRKDGSVLETLIDTEYLDLVSSYKTWSVTTSSHRNQPYALTHLNKKKNALLHRILTSAPQGKVVDHINHDTLDNRLCNLRVLENFENLQNRKGAQKDNKISGVRGVYFDKKANKWRVTLKVKGKQYHFGFYSDLKDAEMAAIEARSKYMPYSQEALTSNEILELPTRLPDDPLKNNNSSRIRNVDWHKNKWRVRIMVNKKRIEIGEFNDLNDAKKAAEQARIKYRNKEIV